MNAQQFSAKLTEVYSAYKADPSPDNANVLEMAYENISFYPEVAAKIPEDWGYTDFDVAYKEVSEFLK